MSDGGEVRVAVVGAGMMARRRGHALRQAGARIVAVASRTGATAAVLAAELGARASSADYRDVARARPDAVLVEVPHDVQDAVVRWALSRGFHVLVGGPLASGVRAGRALARAARTRGCVLEAGFEARYKAAWETTRRLLREGAIGRMVAVRSVALWQGDPASWYYDQAASGGMPLAHLTYCFVNPVRWILGEPTHVSAFANRVRHTAPGAVREETAVVNLRFADDVVASMTAGFVRPADDGASWTVTFLGTEGILELSPTEMDAGSLRLLRGGEARRMEFTDAPEAFAAQASAFLAAVRGGDECRNEPEDALEDLRVAAAVATSARTLRTVSLVSAAPR